MGHCKDIEDEQTAVVSLLGFNANTDDSHQEIEQVLGTTYDFRLSPGLSGVLSSTARTVVPSS